MVEFCDYKISTMTESNSLEKKGIQNKNNVSTGFFTVTSQSGDFLKIILFLIMSACFYLHTSTGAHEYQWLWIPLELELQQVMSHLLWVLELRSPARVLYAHKC